jgi:hypothetical protein
MKVPDGNGLSAIAAPRLIRDLLAPENDADAHRRENVLIG